MIPALAAASPAVALGGSFVAAYVDARTGYIPTAVTRATALLAVACACAAGDAVAASAGAFAAGAVLFALYAFTRGGGIGFGDVKLAIALGAGLGAAHALLALACAFIIGACVGCVLLATGRARRGDAIRFGPFLALGATLACALPVHA